MNTSQSPVVLAQQVPDDERVNTLPKHFGRNMQTVEQAIYTLMRGLAPDYRGAYWHFYELSNGGFYMAPQLDHLRMKVDTNGCDVQMTADAAGITVCLFAFSHLSFHVDDQDIVEHFHLLREFALQHSEASNIIAAID